MTDDNLTQLKKVLDEPGSVSYTLSDDDIQACRRILRRMLADDQVTGGYAIGNVQAYPSKAQVMVEFANKCGALATGEIAARTADSSDKLGSLCRKVIAHYDTHAADADRLAKLEAFLKASDDAEKMLHFDYGNANHELKTLVDRFKAAREALG
jgi:hypothetical protein